MKLFKHPLGYKYHWLRITSVTYVINVLMKLKRKKFTFPISRVWGAGFCAVIYNGDSRSQSCSGIVQTLGLMSCCWIRLPRKSAKNLFSKEPSGKGNTFTAHQDIQPTLYLHTHRGETAQTLKGMYQQCWRPPRSYSYEQSPFQGKCSLGGHICNACWAAQTRPSSI